MKVTRRSVDTTLERQIIAYCITNDTYLGEVVRLADPSWFQASHSQITFRWCAEYYHNYKKAPNDNIKDIYLQYRTTLEDEDADTIGTFLQSISDMDTEIQNVEYAINTAKDYLRLRSLELLNKSLTDTISNRDLLEAERLLTTYNKVERIKTSAVDIFDNTEAVVNAFSMEDEILFELDGAFGKMLGPVKRSDFIAFMGPPKRGKSWWLLEMGVEAVFQGLNVLFVSLEMTEAEMIRRIYTGLSYRPLKDATITIPYFYQEEKDGKWLVEWNEEFRKGIDASPEGIEKINKHLNKYTRNKGGFKLLTLPTKSVTMEQLRSQVESLEFYEGFQADVIVIDYLDILKIEGKDNRIAIGETWAKTRGWAEEKKVAIITASQGNRGSINSGSISGNQIAEDISKLNHATLILGINATEQEKAMGLYRINQLATRHNKPFADQVVCASCLEIASPCIDSRWLSECQYEVEEDEDEN